MKAHLLLFLLLSFGLAGCVNLKPKPDRTEIFALASDVAAAAEIGSGIEVYVTRVELPGFLEGTRIHYRSANGELESFSGARWAEDPAEALPRAIAIHLQATGQVNVRGYYPWANTKRDAANIAVQFERFSANASGQVEVVAQWQITFADGHQTEGRYVAPNLQWNGNEVADYVAQLNTGIADLAASIAKVLPAAN